MDGRVTMICCCLPKHVRTCLTSADVMKPWPSLSNVLKPSMKSANVPVTSQTRHHSDVINTHNDWRTDRMTHSWSLAGKSVIAKVSFDVTDDVIHWTRTCVCFAADGFVDWKDFFEFVLLVSYKCVNILWEGALPSVFKLHVHVNAQSWN